eukprot:6275136-Lingulodinium_polyedra.AAC.1
MPCCAIRTPTYAMPCHAMPCHAMQFTTLCRYAFNAFARALCARYESCARVAHARAHARKTQRAPLQHCAFRARKHFARAAFL